MPSASSYSARFRRTFWSMPCTGRVCWRRPLAVRAGRPPWVRFSCVRLDVLNRSAIVVVASRGQHLRFGDGRDFVGVVVLEGQCGAREDFGFAVVQRDGPHRIAGLLRLLAANEWLQSSMLLR